jgi:demethylspheroidene O-methyltransferase
LADHGAIVQGDRGLRAMIGHHAHCCIAISVIRSALFDGSRLDTEMRRLWSYAGSGRETAVETGGRRRLFGVDGRQPVDAVRADSGCL